MNATSTETPTLRIVQSTADYLFLVEDRVTNEFLRDRKGNVRRFCSRAGARKAITRQLRGDFS